MWETWVWSLVRKIPRRRERLPSPVFWPEEFHDYTVQGVTKSWTRWQTFTHSLWSYLVDHLCVGCILSLFPSSFHTFLPPTILSFFFFFFSFLNVSNYRKLSILVSMFQPQYLMADLMDTILEDRFHSHQWGNVIILFINLFTDNIILT